MSGPSATPTPAVAAQTPMALPRSRAGNTLVMIDSVAGMMNAPPMPMNARLAISGTGEPAIAEASEPSPNTTKPTGARDGGRSGRRGSPPSAAGRRTRGCRSRPSTAAGCWWRRVRRTIAGRATLRIELSSTITSRLKHSTPRISQRRSSALAWTRSDSFMPSPRSAPSGSPDFPLARVSNRFTVGRGATPPAADETTSAVASTWALPASCADSGLLTRLDRSSPVSPAGGSLQTRRPGTHPGYHVGSWLTHSGLGDGALWAWLAASECRATAGAEPDEAGTSERHNRGRTAATRGS